MLFCSAASCHYIARRLALQQCMVTIICYVDKDRSILPLDKNNRKRVKSRIRCVKEWSLIMENKEKLLRDIPHVDGLLRSAAFSETGLPRTLVADHVRLVLTKLREGILAGTTHQIPDTEAICAATLKGAREEYTAGIRPVINGTGVVLHSNLGRACLSEKAAAAVTLAASSFSTLEYDLKAGRRGSRTAVTEAQLRRLTGAQAALVVNNNAAAVLLILSALARAGNVIVSRGELIEIGGSFRIPEIMEQCGCSLREVGTTNKTRIADYERAINDDTCALLKVHTSNYKITGFTEDVSIKSLVELAEKHDLPVIEDIGSCSLTDLAQFGITDEPDAAVSLADGADVVCFSGDKLLGGPQCGIILGKAKYLTLMKSHPLYRALRVDKMTIAALEETLRSYMEPGRAQDELPVISMLAQTPQQLRDRADRLCTVLADMGITSMVIPITGTVGGGSVPGQELASYAVSLTSGAEGGATRLERALLTVDRPVIGRIVKDAFLLDVRTIFDGDVSLVADMIRVANECIIAKGPICGN